MNEMKINKIIKGLVALAVILIIVISYLVIHQHLKRFDSSELTEVGPKVNVLVIDNVNQSSRQILKNIDSGTAPLLLWIENKEGSKQAFTFNTLESLVRLEQNKLGFLEASDPGLNNLYIATYNAQNKTLSYKSMESENISVIEASRNYLIGEILSDSKNNKKPAGKVIFLDGSTKELRMVKIPESQISDATLLPFKTKKTQHKTN